MASLDIVSSQRSADEATTRRIVRDIRPQTARQLRAWIRIVLGFHMPARPIVPGNDAPMAYLAHAFFQRSTPRDCIVWANRGGGKTQLGAIATLLDLLFKPGVQVRILGGSFDQASKMYAALQRMIETELFADVLAHMTGRSISLSNGSTVEVLTQSQRAVRGQRVHIVRCDEVELFDPDVWRAAQLVTRSGRCGDVYVHGVIEALSTMHRPFGLMQSLIADASAGRRRLFRWNLLDSIERCPPSRPCAGCALWSDCGGRARAAEGYVHVDDAITQKQRVGLAEWRSEMLCEAPDRSDAVYPEFDRSLHVSRFNAPAAGDDVRWVCGMDFGYRSPTVLLFAFVDQHDVLYVIDELVVRETTVARVMTLAGQRNWPQPLFIGADPAGLQRSALTGSSAITRWRKAGWNVRTCHAPLAAGIEAVRRRLRPACDVFERSGDDGLRVGDSRMDTPRGGGAHDARPSGDDEIGDAPTRLRIHKRCAHLIDAMERYHYRPGVAASSSDADKPVKDGSDHACDALRYLIINLDAQPTAMDMRGY